MCVSMCVCVCMYVYICVCMYVCVCVCMYDICLFEMVAVQILLQTIITTSQWNLYVGLYCGETCRIIFHDCGMITNPQYLQHTHKFCQEKHCIWESMILLLQPQEGRKDFSQLRVALASSNCLKTSLSLMSWFIH